MELHKLAEAVRAFSRNPVPEEHFFSVIIAAAGNGTRMGSETPKQWMALGDTPVVVRTIRQFQLCPFVHEIIVAARPGDMEAYRACRKSYGFDKLVCAVTGGETRQASVLAALERVSPDSEYVIIHDAARCLITPDMIRSVCHAACISKAATAAEPVHDTIKIAADGCISETPDRSLLWRAQTPQIFRTDLYRAAAYTAQKEGFTATDDCALVEHIGFSIRLVDCGQENMKITTPLDLRLAETILAVRAEAAEAAAQSAADSAELAGSAASEALAKADEVSRWYLQNAAEGGAFEARRAAKNAKKAARTAADAAKKAAADAAEADRIAAGAKAIWDAEKNAEKAGKRGISHEETT